MPKFAKSKSEMVAAGVVPIDKLTEIRAPVQVVADRCGRAQLEAVYGIKLPAEAGSEPSTAPKAGQLLMTYALLRGWTAGSGLPDESRAGRQMLKDYTAGKLLYCCLPPGNNPPGIAPMPAVTKAKRDVDTTPAASTSQYADDKASTQNSDVAADPTPGPSTQQAQADLNEADLDLLQSLDGSLKDKAKRPEYKFHKKAARTKGNRGQVKDGGGYDGAAMVTGKKGGLVRVGAYM
jgi:large subunit GTPase 1